MTDARTMQIAAGLAARINGASVAKASGMSVSAPDLYPAASVIRSVEMQIERQEKALEKLVKSVAALSPGLLFMAFAPLAWLASVSVAACLPEVSCPPAIVSDERLN